MSKDFRQEFYKFRDKLANKEPFALSRANDGEAMILFNESLNLLNKCNGEFCYESNNPDHVIYRQKLLDSVQYRGDNYYVGIGCRCKTCMGDERHEILKSIVNQDETMLTYGNLMVNSNYPYFIKEYLPLFSQYNVIMIINEKARLDKLPFYNEIIKDFRVGTNSWMTNTDLETVIPNYIKENNINNSLFIFCAGPFSNILITECYKVNPNNTYLDCGSTLDPYLFDDWKGRTRGYLNNGPTLQQYCVW